ncbi:MAG: esterase-like activity of phytase family protein [Pseudomonadota bacterium]|nr:esterase-like activity of phytase family protein [Pseudomonadota bacterium]
MSYTIKRLAWDDPSLGTVDCPRRPMPIRASFGSGLARRRGDLPGRVWGVGDRGPNLKIKTAVERYGLDHLREHGAASGAKLMPRPDIGPTMAELQVHEDRVELLRIIRLTGTDRNPISGLPIPGSEHARAEPALNLSGDRLPPDPEGADTEGIAASADGSFFIGDEYGPALLKVGPDGRVTSRWTPGGSDGALPLIAGKRQLNRGFEAIALSPDETWLYLAFQSPLAHPDEEAHAGARHVRIWKLEAASGRVEDQFLYPLDPPDSFRRDCAKGGFGRSDVKVSEIVAEAGESLLVLERGSETTKIYRTRLDPPLAVDASHLSTDTRPTVEELSGAGGDLPELQKELLLSTDANPEVAADLEGMAILSPTELLLVSDNDFGVEGAETSFWRVTFDEPQFERG